MADRTKPFLFCLFLSALWGLTGCGVSQQAKFQKEILPEPPATPVAAADTPAILAPPQPPPFSLRAQALVERAGRRFEQGRKFYRAKNAELARREFDAALDLMLEASEHPIMDREALERRIERMVESIHRYDLAGLGSGAVEEPGFEAAPLEDILEMTFPVDPRLKTKVRAQLQATASQLPLLVTDEVLGYIHHFSGRGRRTLINGFERAGRYKPMIQRILDEEGVPQELIYLAQAESGFRPRAVSRKRATGMWQFMASRGREYGLVQTSYTDDRLDPEKATRAAARHLRDLYTQFGDWYLAIAAYNCGPVTVEKAVERTGYADFWELRRRRVMPAETTNYVPIILAMTIMAKNAEAYGLDEIEPDPPAEYDTLEVTATTHLKLVADLTDAPLSELMELNPALLKGVAPAGFALHVPRGTADTLVAALEMIPPDRRASWRIHKVSNGETLGAIGKRYGTAPGTIAAANQLSAEGPVEGDQLLIPVASSPQAAARPRAGTQRKTVRRQSAARPAAKRTAGAASARSHTPAGGN